MARLGVRRYVRAYRLGTYVHSEKAKIPHIQNPSKISVAATKILFSMFSGCML